VRKDSEVRDPKVLVIDCFMRNLEGGERLGSTSVVEEELIHSVSITLLGRGWNSKIWDVISDLYSQEEARDNACTIRDVTSF